MNLAELFEEIGVIKSSKPETDYAKLVQSVCKILTDDVFPKSTLVIKQCRTEQCRSKFISDIQNVVQGKNL